MLPPTAFPADLLADPLTHDPVAAVDSGYESAAGKFFPMTDGFPDFRIADRPLRHRFWAWVYNRTSFGYDFGVRVGWRLALGGAPIDRTAYLSRLAIRPGMRVLETAVGTGSNLLELPPGANYLGFDLSPAMLRRCRAKLAQAARPVSLMLADMAAAPFLDDSFDVVFHMGGLQFLSNPARGIAEMHRVARPGGQVLIVDERSMEKRLAARSGARNLRDLAPTGVREIQYETISEGELFALEFIK